MTRLRRSVRPERWGGSLAAAAALLVITACTSTENPGRDTAEAREAPAGSIPGHSAAPTSPPDTTGGAPTAEEVARAAATEAGLRPVTRNWGGGDRDRGAGLYAVRCVTCHGAGGEGDGRAAAAINPKPRNFTTGVYYIDGDADNQTGEAEDLARVIAMGPAAFGGSSAMPPWGGTLSDEEIQDLVAYLRAFANVGEG